MVFLTTKQLFSSLVSGLYLENEVNRRFKKGNTSMRKIPGVDLSFIGEYQSRSVIGE
jgi:hypothetical protein